MRDSSSAVGGGGGISLITRIIIKTCNDVKLSEYYDFVCIFGLNGLKLKR